MVFCHALTDNEFVMVFLDIYHSLLVVIGVIVLDSAPVAARPMVCQLQNA